MGMRWLSLFSLLSMLSLLHLVKGIRRSFTNPRLVSRLYQTYKINGYECNEVLIQIDDYKIKILEANMNTQEELINLAIENEGNSITKDDVYGIVLWPAAKVVARKLISDYKLDNLRVCEIGSGTGLVSLAVAMAGKNVQEVYATDYNPFCIELINKAIEIQRNEIKCNIATSIFDAKDFNYPLPSADIYCFADVLYDQSLGVAVAKRIFEAIKNNKKVIIADAKTRLGKEFSIEFSHVLTLSCIGRQPMLDKLNELLLADNRQPVSFTWVTGEAVQGERDMLISTPDKTQTVPVGLLEL